MHHSGATALSLKLVLPSEVRLVDLVHAASEKMAQLAGFGEDESLNVALALREAVINAMVHGNHRDPALKVEVVLSANGRGMRARVVDQGSGFDPTTEPDPTAPENRLNTSGRGLLLIRAFVDEVGFRRRAHGMEVTLKKKLGAGPPPAERDGSTRTRRNRT